MHHGTSGKEEKVYLFDRPRNVQRLLRGLYIACALLLAGDFIIHRHISYPLEKLPGFYALYGFIGCVLLVLVAKWMRGFLMRPENYYDRDASAESRENGAQRDA